MFPQLFQERELITESGAVIPYGIFQKHFTVIHGSSAGSLGIIISKTRILLLLAE
jgi:hypothetical protein